MKAGMEILRCDAELRSVDTRTKDDITFIRDMGWAEDRARGVERKGRGARAKRLSHLRQTFLWHR